MILDTGVRVIVSNPTPPIVTVQAPTSRVQVLVPVPGPPGAPGAPGAGGASDISIASVIEDPTSLTRAVLIPVIDDEIDEVTVPPIDLTILFENAKA